MDQILESIIERLGNLEQALLIDDYAEGKDTGLVDLLLIGNIDQVQLQDLSQKTEKYIGRKIRTLVMNTAEFKRNKKILDQRPSLLIWSDRD